MRGKDFAEVIRLRNFSPAQIANHLTMIAHSSNSITYLTRCQKPSPSIRDLSILSSSNRLEKPLKNNTDSYRVDRCHSSIRYLFGETRKEWVRQFRASLGTRSLSILGHYKHCLVANCVVSEAFAASKPPRSIIVIA